MTYTKMESGAVLTGMVGKKKSEGMEFVVNISVRLASWSEEQ